MLLVLVLVARLVLALALTLAVALPMVVLLYSMDAWRMIQPQHWQRPWRRHSSRAPWILR